MKVLLFLFKKDKLHNNHFLHLKFEFFSFVIIKNIFIFICIQIDPDK